LALVLMLTAAAVAVLVMVVVAIHAEERRISLSDVPRTRSRALARRVLGAHAAPRASVRIHASARR
ncbi:MAG: hypothetical protein ACRDNF_01420, partial [Streptosporangiaceae bacterium]